jgi:hypothetical protein
VKLPPLFSTLIKAIKKENDKGEKETYCLIYERIIEKTDCSFYQVEIVPLVWITSYPNTSKSLFELRKSANPVDNKFQVTINKETMVCKLGPYNNILLNNVPRGSGIGTYAFGHLINMLKAAGYSDYETSEEKLTSSDAKRDGGENGRRRDKFYTNLGFTINVDPAGDGKILLEKVGNLWNDALAEDRNKRKVEEINLEDFIRKTMKRKLELEEDLEKNKKIGAALKKSLEEERSKKIPFYKCINRTIFGTGIVVGMILGYVLIQIGTYLGIYR